MKDEQDLLTDIIKDARKLIVQAEILHKLYKYKKMYTLKKEYKGKIFDTCQPLYKNVAEIYSRRIIYDRE